MSRILVCLALLAAGSLSVLPHSAAAASGSSGAYFGFSSNGDDEEDKGDKLQVRKDLGSIEGEVVSVDYRTSHFGVKSGTTVYDVTVLPSTDFRGSNNAFRGFSDIKKGAHITVMLSQRATSFVAQIIRLH